MRPTEIQAVLQAYSIVLTKAKGQNFLMDDAVADREVELLNVSPADRVLEIGPGLGMLTERLLGLSDKLTCIELDARLCAYLKDKFDDRFKLVQADALEIDLPPFDRFISNLPYSISSPLLFKILDHRFERGIIMVQKEFAERMVAKAGSDDYSRLSVSAYYRARCELLGDVSRGKFWPQPEVDSCIVLLEPRPAPFSVTNERFYFTLVNALFQHRRKKISSVLKMTGLAPKAVLPTLPHMDERVEVLTPEEIGRLADAILAAR
jgi:16S rRNA (adenine1518-N6/adenine1519-N6)-dimethyltransferase